MNKFDRVFSILILLQTKSIITAKSIAERFDISDRTVYRDIATLRNAGIPIIGDPGIGYSIMDGYRIPPLMFTEGETSALLTAEKFIGKITDQDTLTQYRSAMLKIKAILRSSEKQSLSVLDDSIAISDNHNWSNKPFLQNIFKSIPGKYVINIHYQKPDDTSSERKVEPIGCYHRHNAWYLVAYCQLKKDYRTFKVNRIADLQVLSEHFAKKHLSLEDYIQQQNEAWKAEQEFHAIEIFFSNSHLEFAERRKYYFGFTEQKVTNKGVQMKFTNSSIEFVARWLLQFGGAAIALAPDILVERMKVLSNEVYQHYN